MNHTSADAHKTRQLTLIPITMDGDAAGPSIRFPHDWESLRDTIDLTHATTRQALDAWETAMANSSHSPIVHVSWPYDLYMPPTVTVGQVTFVVLLEWVNVEHARTSYDPAQFNVTGDLDTGLMASNGTDSWQ